MFLLLGPVSQIELFKFGLVGITAALLNNISTLIITIGALMFFKDFTKSFASMFGIEDAYGVGAKAVQDSAKKVTKGALMATGLVGGIANSIKASEMKRMGDTETAKKYQDMAKARFKQMGTNFGSLATNGISDGVLKDVADSKKASGVDKAEEGLKGAKTVKEANKEHDKELKDKASETTIEAIDSQIAEIKKKKKAVKGLPVLRRFKREYRALDNEQSGLYNLRSARRKQLKAEAKATLKQNKADREDMAAGFTPEELAAEVSRIDAELQKTDKSTDRYKELLAQKAEVDRIQDEQMDPKDRAIKEQIQKSLKKAEQKRQKKKKKSQKQARKEARAERKQQVEKAKQDIDKLSSK